ncbi:effector-associated domain 2-containing protein [Actinomadura chokoriensis]|uniref:Effector-associated domain-containing protein n=1 Tax=Actinomadura chokoriensis TaxID=454156 RepID=A0ABV4R077_9ACTN
MTETMRPAPGGWRPGGMCSFLVCDIAGFSDASRVDPVRVRVRKAMYDGLDRSLAEAGLRLDDCYHEDRGDGVMVVLPPDVRTELLLTAVVGRLRAEVRHHNEAASEPARMRLRVAVNVGEAESDGRGIVSTALTHAFRLLDAAPLKEAVAAAETGIALIVSRRVYDDVVRHGRGLVDPGDYYRVRVQVKETSDDAWVMVPGGRPVRRAGAVPAVPGWESAPEPSADTPLPDIPLPDMFRIVDGLLEIPRLRAERGRDQVVAALSLEIAGVVPRSAEARADLFAIVRTCLDYSGGLRQLLQAVQGFVGESMAVRRLEQTIARSLLPPPDDAWPR